MKVAAQIAMNTNLVKKLNQVNQDFYQKTASSFSSTRQQPWHGWEQMLESFLLELKQKKLRVLDLGCGNGRFAEFLKKTELTFEYLGVDQSTELLHLAKEQLTSILPEGSFTLQKLDIVDQLIEQKPLFNESIGQFDLIVVFGVMHHIPSKQLRQELLQQLQSLLNHNGVLVVSFWQFDRNLQLFARRVDPIGILGAEASELESGDFFLTWEREVRTTRYCHLTNFEEQQALINTLSAKVINTFEADGKSGHDNQYWVIQKTD